MFRVLIPGFFEAFRLHGQVSLRSISVRPGPLGTHLKAIVSMAVHRFLNLVRRYASSSNAAPPGIWSKPLSFPVRVCGLTDLKSIEVGFLNVEPQTDRLAP